MNGDVSVSAELFFDYMHHKQNGMEMPTTEQQIKLLNDVIGQLAGGYLVTLTDRHERPVCNVRKSGNMREFTCIIV